MCHEKWAWNKPILLSMLQFMLCKPNLAYSSIWTSKVSQIYLQTFCLVRRLEERTSDALVYAQFFFCEGPSDIWWGIVLDAEMTYQSVKCLLCPWSSSLLFGMYQDCSNLARKKRLHVVQSMNLNSVSLRLRMPLITFIDKDLKVIDSAQDDPMVIIVDIDNFLIMKMLVNQGSSLDILYWKSLKDMRILSPKLPTSLILHMVS